MMIFLYVLMYLFELNEICAAFGNDTKKHEAFASLQNPRNKTRLQMQLEIQKAERTKAWIEATSFHTVDSQNTFSASFSKNKIRKALSDQLDCYSEKLKKLKLKHN